MARRKRIAPEETVEVAFTARERALVLKCTLAGPDLTEPLAKAEPTRGRFRAKYTLDDLDELIGFLSAEANHAKDRRVQREADALCGRLRTVMESYDDGSWQEDFRPIGAPRPGLPRTGGTRRPSRL